MIEFELSFLFDDKTYTATVNQNGNIFHVFPQDSRLQQLFGEAVLLEANGDFAWQNPGPEFYKFALSIANALKQHLGF